MAWNMSRRVNEVQAPVPVQVECTREGTDRAAVGSVRVKIEEHRLLEGEVNRVEPGALEVGALVFYNRLCARPKAEHCDRESRRVTGADKVDVGYRERSEDVPPVTTRLSAM